MLQSHRTMKLKFYLKFAAVLLLICSLLYSCSKSEEEVFRTSDLHPPEVTGYYVRNLFGEYIDTVGTPNVKLGDVSNNWLTSNYHISAFPIPADNEFRVFIKDPSNSVKKIWLVPANSPQFVHNDVTNTVVIGGTPVLQLETDSDYAIINSSSIPNGFYKLYVQVKGHLLHDNILIHHK